MHRLGRIVALACVLALSLAGGSAVASAHPQHDRDGVAGHVYVNNNTAGVNTISGFNRNEDGSLTPIPGSPFAIGGAGIGSATGSAGALQMSADGKYLLAVDAGSNQISVARIGHDGSLRAVSSSPVASNGQKPVSIGVSGDLVYVANAGAGGSNYTGFTLNGGGHLRPIAQSTFALPDNANPGHVLFSPDGKFLVGIRVGPDAGPSFIDTFTVGQDGRLTAAAGSPFSSQAVGPFGSVFNPANPAQLFVTNAHAGPGAGSVSVYNLTTGGVLNATAGSPFADGQTAACWAAITRDGRELFVVNTGSSSVSSYAVGTDGMLTVTGTTAMTNPGPGGLGAFDDKLTPDGRYLYVVDASGRISGFSVSAGTVTELPSSPVSLTAGATPFGLVVD